MIFLRHQVASSINTVNDISCRTIFVGQSIELSLKAFLVTKKFTVKQLRQKEFGHNIDALLEKAVENNLSENVTLETAHGGAMRLLSQEYASRRFQYIETGFISLPLDPLIDECAQLLTSKLKQHCYNYTYK